jgi:hypothetical protein
MGEMFVGHSADTGAGKFPLVSMGAERRVSRAQTRERGPPSALAEIGNFGPSVAVQTVSDSRRPLFLLVFFFFFFSCYSH